MKNTAMRFFLGRMSRLVIGVFLFLISLAVYNSYKYFFWSHAQAVVTSIEPVCVYAKKTGRSRSSTREYLSCDGGAEAERLIADGYELRPDKQALIKAVHEAELGRKAETTLRPLWKSVAHLRPGSAISVRYSPASPDEAELITGGEMAPVVILGVILGALLFACLIAVLTYEGDEEAAPGS